MHAADLLGVGFSFTGHANDLFVHRIGLAGKVRRARFVVCISEFHRELYERLGGERQRLPIVHCGIDAERFPLRDGEPAGIPMILGVGRLVEKKGFHVLIDACARLRDRGVEFRCVIAGSGPEEARLLRSICNHRLETLVEVTGVAVLQEELPVLLGSATIFALPCVQDRDGDLDGLPQVLIEAQCCGVPVVSTELVGIPDLIEDGVTGTLVAPDDAEALAEALSSLLADPVARAEQAAAGAARARRWFSLEEAVARLTALFDEALHTPNGSPPTAIFDAPAHGTRISAAAELCGAAP